MLNAGGTAIPTGVTNLPSFYPTSPATNVQTAIAAGMTPTAFGALSPIAQQQALAQAASSPVAPSGGGGAPLISFSGGGTLPIGYGTVSVGTGPQNLTAGQIQAAVNAGLTPSAYAALSPAQQAALTPHAAPSTANAAMPILIIGIALFVLLAANKGRA